MYRPRPALYASHGWRVEGRRTTADAPPTELPRSPRTPRPAVSLLPQPTMAPSSNPLSPPDPERQALDELFSVTYEELRRLAAQVRRDDPGATVTPTALVNEAWLKLAGSPWLADTSPLHFRRVAARAMRQVLVEAARRRKRLKRGGATAIMVTFDESLDAPAGAPGDILALDEALEELARMSPRQASVVESRFFGGLDVSETALMLGVSEATVLRDWRAARAWLAVEMGAAGR